KIADVRWSIHATRVGQRWQWAIPSMRQGAYSSSASKRPLRSQRRIIPEPPLVTYKFRAPNCPCEWPPKKLRCAPVRQCPPLVSTASRQAHFKVFYAAIPRNVNNL